MSRKASRRSRVLLISMPYGALERPAFGISLLKPILQRAGVECDVRYLTFPFAELVGYDDYRWVSADLPYTAFAGDWTFAAALHGEDPARDRGYLEEVLQASWGLGRGSIERLLQVRSLTGHFLDHCLASVDWGGYALVGFTSTFEQNVASLALARRVKAAHPEVGIVFGGANWEGDMGMELHRRFPFVDYSCSGEAELSFPALVESVLSGREPEDVAGIVFRKGGESVFTGPAPLTRDLDSLPVPDFADFFAALAESSAGSSIAPTLLVETSRGCWWGAKSHCTFCGLNGSGMAFRSKSGARALEEIEHLAERWQADMVEAVDNILDMRYFETLLPALAGRARRLHMFYEVKANLSREQVGLLARAGVYRIQPGIESLSDHVLKLMRKGTTGLRNVQLLKWCSELGVQVDWNLLYGFPGETAEDYAALLELLPSIRFLQPPGACGPIRLDRFSPYFNDPGSFGLCDVRPMAPYRYLYPFPEESLARIAYYFEFGYRPGTDPGGMASEVIRYAAEWRNRPEQGALWAAPLPDGGLVLEDSRSDASCPRVELSSMEAAAYRYCDEARSGAGVVRFLRSRFPEERFEDVQVLGFLDSLVANRLMATDGTHYLGLALGAAPLPDLVESREPEMLKAV